MKKTLGIILIAISVLNMISWIPDNIKGKTESPIYYIFILILMLLGIIFLNKSKKV